MPSFGTPSGPGTTEACWLSCAYSSGHRSQVCSGIGATAMGRPVMTIDQKAVALLTEGRVQITFAGEWFVRARVRGDSRHL